MLTLTTPPTVEPITLAEVKTHARIMIDAEDSYLTGLITAARQKWEAETGFYLSEAAYTLTGPASGVVELPLRPVLSVELVSDLVVEEDYTVEIDPETGICRITIINNTNGELEILFKVGFANPEEPEGEEDPEPHPAPELTKHALKTLVAHWYNCRESHQAGAEVKTVPGMYQSIVQTYRIA